MTDKNKTVIGLLVDRSGSMGAIKEDMEGGIRSFIESQKEVPGECQVALAQFDNVYDLVYPLTDLSDAPDYRLVPRSMTALNDACGYFITWLGEELYKLPEDERPGTVIVNIITDGFENSSREWTLESVRKLMDQQRDVYDWEFVFMGSDVTTETTAHGYGIDATRTIRYSTEAVDTGMNAGATMSGLIRTSRLADPNK